jgi:pimeloyl-ACP methyl ester carboxylesterase
MQAAEHRERLLQGQISGVEFDSAISRVQICNKCANMDWRGTNSMIRKWSLWIIFILSAPLVLFFAARGMIAGATRLLESRYPPPGQMVSVGSHRLHLYCTGRGAPTVIVEPGMGLDWVAWEPVIRAVSSSNTVCVYDRGGYGWSDAGPMPRTGSRLATELHSLLVNGRVSGPYLLVGHSVGGYIARMYASQFPDGLMGVILVDSLQEGRGHRPAAPPRGALKFLPPIGWERLKRLYRGESALPHELRDLPKPYRDRYLFASSLAQLKSERNEFDSLYLSDAELAQAKFPRELPLTVITAGTDPNHWENQLRLVALSNRSIHVRAPDSGHSVQHYRPDLIIDAVQKMTAGANKPESYRATSLDSAPFRP